MTIDALDLEFFEREFLELEREGFMELASRLRTLVTPAVIGEAAAAEPSADELLKAWADFHPSYRAPDPEARGIEGWMDREGLDALRRVLRGDRMRRRSAGAQLQDKDAGTWQPAPLTPTGSHGSTQGEGSA